MRWRGKNDFLLRTESRRVVWDGIWKFPTRLWVLLPKLSVRFIVCKQKRVVRVKDHKSVLSCFHVKIDLTDEQMDFKYWQMGNEIKRIRIRVVPRSKIDFVSKRMCNFKSISSETEFFFAKTRRKILCSCKGSRILLRKTKGGLEREKICT